MPVKRSQERLPFFGLHGLRRMLDLVNCEIQPSQNPTIENYASPFWLR